MVVNAPLMLVIPTFPSLTQIYTLSPTLIPICHLLSIVYWIATTKFTLKYNSWFPIKCVSPPDFPISAHGHDTHLLAVQHFRQYPWCLLLLFQLLQDICFTMLCWFLPHINMNQPQVYLCHFPLEPPSHLPPHPTPLDCQSTVMSSMCHIANFHWLSI